VIPDYLAPLVGYRVWSVWPNGLLTGLAIVQPWRPKHPMVASCNGHDQARIGNVGGHLEGDAWVPSPVKSCVCGIYAAKDLSDAEAELQNWRWSSQHETFAIGETWLWGTLVEHVKGYRAQFAYPKALTIYGSQEVADRVSVLYGIATEMKEPPKAETHWIDLGTSYSFTVPLTYQPIHSGYITSITWGDDDTYEKPVETPQQAKARKKEEARAKHKERIRAQRRGWKAQPWL
jgi:hypothetical protein